MLRQETAALLHVARCMRDELHRPGDHVFDQGAPADGLRSWRTVGCSPSSERRPAQIISFAGTTTRLELRLLPPHVGGRILAGQAKSHSQVYSGAPHPLRSWGVCLFGTAAARRGPSYATVRQVAAV